MNLEKSGSSLDTGRGGPGVMSPSGVCHEASSSFEVCKDNSRG